MTKLIVSQFSCIDHAELELGNLTILIGPQASGKSVICKLVYFFYNVINTDFFVYDEERNWKSFSAKIVDDFKQWFPPSAWGKRRFTIDFEAGPIKFSIARTVSANRPGQNVRLVASDYLMSEFDNYTAFVSDKRKKQGTKPHPPMYLYEERWRAEEVVKKKLASDLGKDYVRLQTFVPAGRSFFTSIGKAVAAFEQSGLLDPVTIAFGRLFIALKDRRSAGFPPSPQTDTKRASRSRQLANLFFGGEMQISRDKEYIESSDGRKIPFSLLSSGQQELLPLWMILEYMIERPSSRQLIYIEEPEAHLFPAAQNVLVAYLASLLSSDSELRLVITTHSPYVLAKLNNLLKAGSIAGSTSKETAEKIARIIPQDSWLKAQDVRAYGVIDKGLQSILGDDGLVDAAYLDEVSGEVAEEFSKLLEIEFGQ
jgi:hypothetical protein